MKIQNIKSVISTTAAALFSAALAVSCTADDIMTGMQGNDGDMNAIYEQQIVLRDANEQSSSAVIELYKEGHSTSLSLHTTRIEEIDIEAQVIIDEEYVAAYNEKNGSAFTAYPASAVTLGNEGKATIAAGQNNASVAVKINPAQLEAGKDYMLSLAVKADNADKAGRCNYFIKDMTTLTTCDKGEDKPKGYLIFEVNDVNPLNALSYELEDGRLVWDVVVLFAANINHHPDKNCPYLKCNPNVQFLLDNNEQYLQPLRKRGMKVLLAVLGNHDQAGCAQLSQVGAQVFAEELANYCKAYNLDGVCFDDEYSDSPDLSNPHYTRQSLEAAARLCYETKQAMPDKLVTVYAYGDMYPWRPNTGVDNVDGVDADQWLDIVVPDYGSKTFPIGQMSYKKCAGLAMEFNRGYGSSLDKYTAKQLISGGYGWFMGFAPNPNRTLSWQRLAGGCQELYGSDIKKPQYYYKKNDTKPYKFEY